MLKSALFLVVFTIMGIFFKQQLAYVLHGLLFIYDKIATELGIILSGNSAGRLLQAMLTLLIIPIIGGGLVALVMWVFKRHSHSHVVACVWIVWTVLFVTLLSQGIPQNTGKRSNNTAANTGFMSRAFR